jgi:hypothetical protein
MVPESPVEPRVNQKKTLTSDDPDNESVMEHKFHGKRRLVLSDWIDLRAT